jgi:SAM-dependent methyltransferase
MAFLPQQHLEQFSYGSIDAFSSRFRNRWALAQETIRETLQIIALQGICDPLTDQPIAPDAIEVVAPNYRESLIHQGLNARERGVLLLLRRMIEAGQLPPPRLIQAYLPEAVTPLAAALRDWLGEGVVDSEFLPDPEDPRRAHYRHEDLCALTFPDLSFDLLVSAEVFEHIYDLRTGLAECLRVLRPGGVLIATFPFAYGRRESIIKARHRGPDLPPEIFGEPEYHGNPLEPEEGSLVYQIPGWEILDLLSELGFSDVSFQGIHSISYGIVAADIPELLLLVARR